MDGHTSTTALIAALLAAAATVMTIAAAAGARTVAATGAATGLRYSSVLDPVLAKTHVGLPQIKVDVGGGRSIAFQKGEPLKVAFFGYGSGFTYSKPELAGAMQVPKRLHIQATIFDPGGDPTKQVSQIQDAMSSGKYNAFVVYPLTTALECNLLTKQAPAKNILVAAIGQPACTNQTSSPGLLTVVPEVGGVPQDYGAWARYIVAHNPGKQEVLLTTGPATDYLSQQAGIALQKAAKASSGFHIEQIIRTDYTPAGALQKGQDALQRFPKTTIDANAFPEGTQGMTTALRVAGMQGTVKVYDFGAELFGLNQLIAGHVEMSVPFYPYTKVKTALEALVIARSGGKVPRFIPYAGHAREPLRSPGDAAMFVTKANAAKFKAEIAEY
jgi:ribose transport system substrate-binding protein